MKTYLYSIILLFFWMITGCSPSLKTVPRLLTQDSLRRELSLQYMKERHGISQKEPSIFPRMVVLHWTAIPTLEGCFRAFKASTLPAHRKELQNSQLNVSAHFLVDRDGTIYRLLPDTAFGRHTIGLNYMAVGVENVGDGKDLPLTEAQAEANIKIVRYLQKKYGIEYLIGHHEYSRFRGTALWKENDPQYFTIKTDPGDAFMDNVRKKLGKKCPKAFPSLGGH